MGHLHAREEHEGWPPVPQPPPAWGGTRGSRKLDTAPGPAQHPRAHCCQSCHPAAHPDSLPAFCQCTPEVEEKKNLSGAKRKVWSPCSPMGLGAGPQPAGLAGARGFLGRCWGGRQPPQLPCLQARLSPLPTRLLASPRFAICASPVLFPL